MRTRVAALLLGMLAACGTGSQSEPAKVESAGVRFEVSLEPAEARMGPNALVVELTDAEGRPLPDAAVDVRVHMHAMGAMPAMSAPASVESLGDGRYRASFELSMGGTWQLEIRTGRPSGPPASVQGSLTVGAPGVRLERSAAAPLDEPAAEIAVDPARLQRIGVRSSLVEPAPFAVRVRAVGRVLYDETALSDVSLRFRGYVGKVEVAALGSPVERGEVLLTVYGPELYAAQQELLQALESQREAAATTAPTRADELARAARNRMRLLGLAPQELRRIERDRKPLEQVPVRAPASGFVTEKSVVEGSAVEPGQRLYRIAPLDRVWLEAQVYESELELVTVGQTASVTLPYRPDHRYEGRVAYVYPALSGATRTARVRIELPNPDLALRPDMYADVELHAERGERLAVPDSAVLHAGLRSFVFLDLGGGRFRPREVELGLRSQDRIEVLRGLAGGERVVTSGTFLIASESRLRAALEQW